MKYFLLLILLNLILINSTYGQVSEIKSNLESEVIITSQNNVPFWMRANQYGSIPLSGFSTSFIGSIHKEYADIGSYKDNKSKLFDWGAGFEGRVNIGEKAEAMLIEAYAKAKLAMFEVKAGRSKDVMGLVDTTLTSGAFSISGNTLGIPKVEISIPEFYALPFWDGLFAFKGNFAHGWLGTIPTQYGNHKPTETYFHQKSLYGRLGMSDWRLHLYGGFNHNAFWGNTKNYITGFSLTQSEEFWYTISGKVYNSSKTGNHVGSIDVGLQYDFDNINLFIYRQQFYDIGGLYHLSNIADGLNGIALTNKRRRNSGFHWNKLLFEFLYTKSQGGELKAKITPSGDENYYNSYVYTQGWSYKQLALGSPLLTPYLEAKEGQARNLRDFFINNRVVAFHIGVNGRWNNWDLFSKLTYSENYGTYGTSPIGHSLGNTRNPPTSDKYFDKVNQFSGIIKISRVINDSWNVGLIGAIDQGSFLNNTTGLIFKVDRKF